MPAGGREPKRKKKPSASLDGGGAEETSGGRAPANLTVADADAFDCGICFHPLKPPIFQCDVGHMLCSPCHDKLIGAGVCHACKVAMPGGYRRCIGMDHVVESVRAPCPNAPYGCAATPPYHGRDEHILACPHAPCHCPGEACGFKASTAGLLEHFRAAHGWPCHIKPNLWDRFTVGLCDGFNFFLTIDDELFLLNVTRHAFCRTVSVVCIRPHAAAAEQFFEHEIRFQASSSRSDEGLLYYEQTTRFKVANYSDLSDGLPPGFNDRRQCILPDDYAHRDEDMEVTIWISGEGERAYYALSDMEDDERI